MRRIGLQDGELEILQQLLLEDMEEAENEKAILKTDNK